RGHQRSTDCPIGVRIPTGHRRPGQCIRSTPLEDFGGESIGYRERIAPEAPGGRPEGNLEGEDTETDGTGPDCLPGTEGLEVPVRPFEDLPGFWNVFGCSLGPSPADRVWLNLDPFTPVVSELLEPVAFERIPAFEELPDEEGLNRRAENH